MPNEPRADNGDSCCHEIGMSLTDERRALDKPLHGWIESDLFAFGSRHTRPSIDDRGEKCACLRQSSAKSRLLRSVAGASSPEFLCPTLRVVKLRPHVMNLVLETDNLVDGQRQRPKSLQREASDSFDNMLLPTSRIMRAAREKTTQTSQRPPCASSQSTVPMFALAYEARWASLSPQVPHAGSKPSLLWPPRSVPQSCRLKSNRTQHLHRLQVASVASGWSQSVPLASSMPMSVDPNCLVNNVWSPVQTHIFLHAVLGKAKHLLHLSAVKHGACESDTEPRLHLRLAEPLATATIILLLLLFCSNEPNAIPACREILARNCIKISRWPPRQATIVPLHPTCWLIACWGLFLEKSAYSSIVFGRGAVGARTKSILKHLVTWKLANHQFTHVQQT